MYGQHVVAVHPGTQAQPGSHQQASQASVVTSLDTPHYSLAHFLDGETILMSLRASKQASKRASERLAGCRAVCSGIAVWFALCD